MHTALSKVSDDVGRRYTFNTAIAANMELLNELNRKGFKVVHIVGGSTTPTLAPYDKQAKELHEKRRYSTSIRPVGSSGGKKPSSSSKNRMVARTNKSSTPASIGAKPVKKSKPNKPKADWRLRVLGQ